ncbi:C-X-C chemokine receptor type 1 [Amia ocellicauda]|uniref:C-X-C chemokine receptor type 1 n=1 Tax=Amia ocellicauda TaxID=2972642 RepID=UPI0034639B1C
MDDPNTSLSLSIEDIHNLFDNSSNYTDWFGYNDSFVVDPKTFTCPETHIAQSVNIAMCLLYWLIFLLAVPGNILVAIVIGLNKHSLTPSDIYLFHLSVADTLFALTIPFWAVSTIQGWVFGDSMCKLVSLVQEINFYSSVLFLVCISIDRYLAIVRALQTRKQRQPLHSWAVCISVWLLGAVLGLPVLFNEAFKPLNSDKEVCYENYDPQSGDQWRLFTRLLRHMLGFLIPLIIMLICYSITICRLLETRSFQKQKAMKVIVAVVIAFLLCWMPYHLTVIVDTLIRYEIIFSNCNTRNIIDLALFATQSLGLLHSCVNPVLYAFVGEKFRKNLLNLLYKMRLLDRTSVSKISRSTSQSSDIIM